MMLSFCSLVLVIAAAPPESATESVESVWQTRRRDALVRDTPKNVTARFTAGQSRIVGKAKTFDDVSELMRNLNNAVWCPKGAGRIVERQRNNTVRVQIDQPLEIAEYSLSELFTNFELKESLVSDGVVAFTLEFGAVK